MRAIADEPRLVELFREGRRQTRLFCEKGYQEAVPLFLEARETSPEWACITAALAETYAFWAFLREISGRGAASLYELSFDEAQRALAAAPDRAECQRAMARALRRGPHADRAARLRASLAAVRINPYDAENCHEHWCAGGYRHDDPLIFKALALDPEFFPAPNDLGVALYFAGKLPEARFHFEKALKLLPGNALALCNLATLTAQEGRREEAEMMLQSQLNDPLVKRTLSSLPQAPFEARR